MTTRVAICNKKGGVGKTTTAVNLSAALALSGKRVLLVDLGPQRNASSTMCTDQDLLSTTTHLRQVLLDGLPLEEAVVPTEVPNLQLLPASIDMETLKSQLANPGGVQRLAHAFRKGPQDRWDFEVAMISARLMRQHKLCVSVVQPHHATMIVP